LAITSLTGGGRSVGIVRSRTQTMEFFFSFFMGLTIRRFELHATLSLRAQQTSQCLFVGIYQQNKNVKPNQNNSAPDSRSIVNKFLTEMS
jgi:hypothetical protein